MKKTISIILSIILLAPTGLCLDELNNKTNATNNHKKNTTIISTNENLRAIPTQLETENKKNLMQIDTSDISKSEFILQAQNEQIKINIKNIDKNDKVLEKYHKKFYNYRKIEDNVFYKNKAISVLKGYKYYNYPEKDNFSPNNAQILKFELQDGDYAILDTNIKSNKKYKYAAEYHKDGSLFGIVQIKTIFKTRKSKTIQFMEYRKGDEDKYFPEHIMFLDIEKEKEALNFAQFIYKYNYHPYVFSLDDLICAQINNDLYLNKESKNLIIKMQSFDIPKLPFSDITLVNQAKIATTNFIATTLYGIALSIFIANPIGLVYLWYYGLDGISDHWKQDNK